MRDCVSVSVSKRHKKNKMLQWINCILQVYNKHVITVAIVITRLRHEIFVFVDKK